MNYGYFLDILFDASRIIFVFLEIVFTYLGNYS